MKILTKNIFPGKQELPYDWRAWIKGEEDGPIGFGSTEEEAIADLKSFIEFENREFDYE